MGVDTADMPQMRQEILAMFDDEIVVELLNQIQADRLAADEAAANPVKQLFPAEREEPETKADDKVEKQSPNTLEKNTVSGCTSIT